MNAPQSPIPPQSPAGARPVPTVYKLEFTGGADGLQGVTIAPLLGRFAFDITGRSNIVVNIDMGAMGTYQLVVAEVVQLFDRLRLVERGLGQQRAFGVDAASDVRQLEQRLAVERVDVHQRSTHVPSPNRTPSATLPVPLMPVASW